ncbi:hypothetical protein T07_7059 [Trichinella nelsoni]|uniref:DUF5641 domain-containing protein n=1 Tax=Trichinella nelsoni TaxID=6336 RepID=A0A0V0RHN6_9BILA|nr:hypothetical protein T07_7059 [Trichinella nelsoni]
MAKSRDEPLTSSIAEDWSKWKREAKNLWKMKIPRCLIPFPVEETDSIELHVYGDASKWAYGAVAYLKFISKDKTTVRFIMSKSRVVPLKTITLPRLENMAALIAAKLVGCIKNSFAVPIQRVICWTDSQIVLSWIRSEAKNWKPFVRNRVELIQQLTERKLWKYCPSENNPADLISRGTSVTKLKDCRLWWLGPPSLLNSEPCESEKTSKENTKHPDVLEERCLFGVISPISDDQFEYNCRHASKQRQEELSIEELNEAELYWMKAVQNETFRDEKSLLMKGKLPENSRLIHLSPFIDEFGHQWHAGVEQTLAALRQRFWILKGRSAVKSVLRRCAICRKENARCLNQIMAPLPKNRLVKTHAFDNVGIDFAGPLYAKERRTISKIYICLFTCMATRAIHLEPTSDMTFQSFLTAFRRFISRRGKPSTALRKVLAKALVSREELVTILCEIEARINARPLTTISDDSNDLAPLTPFHFLTGRTLMKLPDMTTRRLVGKKSTSTTMTLRRRWYYQRKILRHLWQRWRKEYLVNFNNRRKWKTQKLEPSIGDIVLLCEDGQTRNNWPLGRILELCRTSDGMKRSALLKTAADTLVRTIKRELLLRGVQEAIAGRVRPGRVDRAADRTVPRLHQREGQTIEQYPQEMAEIGRRAGVSERDLVARFAAGITLQEAYLAIRLQEPATLTEARRLDSKVMRTEEDFHQRQQTRTGNPKPEKTEATQPMEDLIHEVRKNSLKLEKQESTAARPATERQTWKP